MIPLLLVAGCDLGTEPNQLTLAELYDPPANHATVAVTEAIDNGFGDVAMAPGEQYFFQLRMPPPVPELIFEGISLVGSLSVLLRLGDATRTGVISTEEEEVEFRFGTPDGRTLRPIRDCRITLLEPAWQDRSGARLRGQSDCGVGDADLDFRVLIKFNYTVP
jgi:hypothetical protein